MKIVIELREDTYEAIRRIGSGSPPYIDRAILEGVILPKGHGRLIDGDELRARMYHEAFETDTDYQRWDSGCWIRYKMFEQIEETALTIVEADKEDCE